MGRPGRAVAAGLLRRRAELASEAAIGVADNKQNLRSEVARGKSTAGFLLQVLAAVGAKEVRLD